MNNLNYAYEMLRKNQVFGFEVSENYDRKLVPNI